MKQITKIFILLLCCWYGMALAADPPPLALMKRVSNNVLVQLQRHKGQLKNRRVVRKIIIRTAVPYFDLQGVARSVAGRNYWYQATTSNRNAFVKVFTRYVIDMYASAIASYSDEAIKFRPMRSYSSSQKRVRIYSTINRPGVPAIVLNYRLVKKGSGWRIYDFSVDGISMVQSYRAQFASILKQGGLPKLTKQLEARYK